MKRKMHLSKLFTLFAFIAALGVAGSGFYWLTQDNNAGKALKVLDALSKAHAETTGGIK